MLNILGKVVASPFSLMGKLIPGGADGEALQFVEFPPGSPTMAPAELKKLEALIKALEERPSLRLDITGAADPVRDRRALGLQKLMVEVQARWRRERGRSSAVSEESIPAEDEQRLIKALYDEQQNKKAVVSSSAKTDAQEKPPTTEEMKRALVEAMPLDEEGLRQLASQRAGQIRDHLTGEGKMTEERVFLLDVDVTASGHELIHSQLTIAAAP